MHVAGSKQKHQNQENETDLAFLGIPTPRRLFSQRLTLQLCPADLAGFQFRLGVVSKTCRAVVDPFEFLADAQSRKGLIGYVKCLSYVLNSIVIADYYGISALSKKVKGKSKNACISFG